MQNTGTKIRKGFLFIGNESVFLNLSLNGLKHMHHLGLVSISNLLDVTETLDNAADLF